MGIIDDAWDAATQTPPILKAIDNFVRSEPGPTAKTNQTSQHAAPPPAAAGAYAPPPNSFLGTPGYNPYIPGVDDPNNPYVSPSTGNTEGNTGPVSYAPPRPTAQEQWYVDAMNKNKEQWYADSVNTVNKQIVSGEWDNGVNPNTGAPITPEEQWYVDSIKTTSNQIVAGLWDKGVNPTTGNPMTPEEKWYVDSIKQLDSAKSDSVTNINNQIASGAWDNGVNPNTGAPITPEEQWYVDSMKTNLGITTSGAASTPIPSSQPQPTSNVLYDGNGNAVATTHGGQSFDSPTGAEQERHGNKRERKLGAKDGDNDDDDSQKRVRTVAEASGSYSEQDNSVLQPSDQHEKRGFHIKPGEYKQQGADVATNPSDQVPMGGIAMPAPNVTPENLQAYQNWIAQGNQGSTTDWAASVGGPDNPGMFM